MVEYTLKNIRGSSLTLLLCVSNKDDVTKYGSKSKWGISNLIYGCVTVSVYYKTIIIILSKVDHPGNFPGVSDDLQTPGV